MDSVNDLPTFAAAPRRSAAATVDHPHTLPHDTSVADKRVQQWRRRLMFLVVAGVVVWAVMTFLVGPYVVRSGYEGTSGIDAVNKAFDHRHAYPLDHYLRKFYKLCAAGLAAWAGAGGLLLLTTSPTFARRIVGTATPGTLGAMRVFVCLVLAYAAYKERVTSVVKLPASERTTMGVMDFVYAAPIGFDRLVKNAPALQAYKAITITVLLVGALGFWTRPALILGAVLYLPLMGIVRSYSWFNHTGVVPFYVLLVLIFTRSGDGWSLDRLRRVWNDRAVPPADVATPYYGWARYAVWLVIALPYVAAGMSKLTNQSWRWWEGINLQTILYTDALRPGHGPGELILRMTWLPTWGFTLMGLMTVLTELGMVLVLFWWAGRMIMPVLTVGMHVGIWVLQKILFLDLIVLQVVFYDWSAIRHALGRGLAAKRGTIDVLYDGRCALCRRSVRLLKGWDLLDRLNYLDFRTLELSSYNAARHVTLDSAELEQSMHVVSRGRVTSGFAGCRTIAAALPIFWLIVPLLYVPGLSHVGAAAYRWLARNRMAFHTCDASGGGGCALPDHADAPVDTRRSLTEAQSPSIAPPIPLMRRLLGPVIVTGIVCFMLGAWSVRVEWYPFTSMQMFSKYRNSGIITYYQPIATDAAGNTYPAPLERMGRGVSRYRPIMSGGFFNDAGRKRCIEMLRFCGETWNAEHPDKRVVQLEVHKREWDFVRHRMDPEFGKTVDRIVVRFSDHPATSATGAPAPGRDVFRSG